MESVGAVRGIQLPFGRVNETTWTDGSSIAVIVEHFDLVPNLPAALNDQANLFRQLAIGAANSGGALVEASIMEADGLPAVWYLVKRRAPGQPTGLLFVGSLIVPRADCSVVLRIEGLETGTTGIRESMVMVTLLGQYDVERLMNWPNPYAPDVRASLPYNLADEPHYDAQFPQHPLAKVRWLRDGLISTVTFDPAFANRPPFHYSA